MEQAERDKSKKLEYLLRNYDRLQVQERAEVDEFGLRAFALDRNKGFKTHSEYMFAMSYLTALYAKYAKGV